MDNQRFDAITRLAATSPDRRGALKLAGAAALLGTAGFLSRSDDAEAALVTVVITNLLNNLSVSIPVQNNNVAVQVCAIVSDVNAILVNDAGASVSTLQCAIEQNTGGGNQSRKKDKK
jgi:hypothetical protein